MTLNECLQCLQPIKNEGDAIRLSIKNHDYPPGTQQLLNNFHINNFVSFQSWFEFNDSTLKAFRFELGFDPAKREFEKKMAEERRKNIAVLNRSTKRWQISIIGVVFRRWRDVLLKMKNAQEKMVKMMYKLKGISTRDVFKSWRTFYRRDQINPVKKKTLTMEERITEIQAQLKHVSSRVRQIEQRKSMTVGVITSLTIDLKKPIETMRLYKEALVEPFEDLSTRYKNCMLERYTMYTYTERLLYLVWASVYLAVLGRNTTVEEEIDDGSFTALNGLQIADLFKRLHFINIITIIRIMIFCLPPIFN
eukprot:g7906.t1